MNETAKPIMRQLSIIGSLGEFVTSLSLVVHCENFAGYTVFG